MRQRKVSGRLHRSAIATSSIRVPSGTRTKYESEALRWTLSDSGARAGAA